MPKQRDIELFIVDVLISIEKIKSYTKSFASAGDLLYNELNWDATLRNLEIIGEAINNLLKDEKLNLLEKDIKQIINQHFDLSGAIEQELPKQANQDIVDYLKNLKKENGARKPI